MNQNNFFKKHFKISKRFIGDSEPVFIVAEAGVSHFGKIEKCFKLVDLAVSAKADAVKFQIFDTNSLIAKKKSKWFNRMKSRILSIDDYIKVDQYCKKKGIIFFLTAHDESSFDKLKLIDPPVYKIGSGEIKNLSFIKKILCNKKPVFISTGMHTFNDVKSIIELCKINSCKKIVFMQCTSSYPTKIEDLNLNVIDTYKSKIKSIVGYSDHTDGIEASLLAVAKGAKVIEKHISLDFNVKNAQDWKVSCGPNDFSLFVKKIRKAEKMLGSSNKQVTEDEKKTLLWARKSIVASKNLIKGHKLTKNDINFKRPGSGISPAELETVIGKKIIKDIGENTLISREDLK